MNEPIVMNVGEIHSIQVSVEPWATHLPPEQRPGVRHSLEARFKIRINGVPELHCVEIVHENDFETRFGWYMERIQKRIVELMKKSKEGLVTTDGSRLFIEGKEMTSW